MANAQHFEKLKDGVEEWNEWYSTHPDVIADFSGACLAGLDLAGVVLTGANLTNSDLHSANLEEADLRGAIMTGSNLDQATLDSADLRFASGLSAAVLSGAHGNSDTQLPTQLDRPSTWGVSPAASSSHDAPVPPLFLGSQWAVTER